MTSLSRSLSAAVLLLAALSLSAQPPAGSAPKADAPKQPTAPRLASTGGRSAHETTSAVVDGNRVTLVYGRPASKNPRTGEMREIWGKLVPYDQVWRTGSDEATLLITEKPLEIDGKAVPAGAYSVWTLPKADGTLTFILNKQIGQWGAVRPGDDMKKIYDPANDLLRADVKKQPLETSVDQFTMAVEKNPAGGGFIKLAWEKAAFQVPFTSRKS